MPERGLGESKTGDGTEGRGQEPGHTWPCSFYLAQSYI